jgi:5-(carboxyamino)imidazole ribonucleotide mutase
MKNVLVVFGSSSDEKVYKPIAAKLKAKANVDLRICSAHRTPELLNKILLEKDYDLIIAGAGLAAHLPGVAASKTVAPVIGVPVNSNFEGLDSFLSIVQMPPGVPVLAVGPGVNPAQDFLLKNYDSVKIIGDLKNKRVDKCALMLEEFDIETEKGKKPLTINFFDLRKGTPKENCINVPLIEKETAKDALTFLKKSKKGYFVGINRGDNAAVFAVSMIDRLRLIDYREAMIKKVMDDDNEVRKR